MHQFFSELWFQLVQEIIPIDQFFVIVQHRLLNIKLDFVIKNSGQRFGSSGVVQFDQPNVHLLELVLHEFLAWRVYQENIVNGAHHEGEKRNTDELHKHVEAVLLISEAFDIAVAHSGQSGDCPIESSDVFG